MATASDTSQAADHSEQGGDVDLQLPYERLKVPGMPAEYASFEIEPLESSAEAAPADPSILIAAFVIQLARYTSQSVVPLNVTSLERGELRSTTRSFRLGPDHDASGEALVSQAQQAIDAGSRRSDSPTGVAGVAIRRDGSGMARIGEFDLQLVVGPGGALALMYNAAVFGIQTIGRFAAHFILVVEQLLRGPHQAAHSFDLLGKDELAALMGASRGPASQYSAAPLHKLVEQHAVTTPNAIAVRYRDATLSYSDLNARANRLARYLNQQGAAAESRVLVCVEPGLEITVALLGILKSGATYVPVDPGYPEARIATIVEDTQPVLVVISRKLAGQLPFQRARLLVLEEAESTMSALSADNPDYSIDAQQTASIYYTSGTTGRPKGVMASHANLVNYICCARERYGFSPPDVMPAIARFSFSISMFELMSPLVAGATSLILDRDHIVDPVRMTRTMQEVTFFHAGPSLLRGLMMYIQRRYTTFESFARVRHASSGGDMVPPELLESLKQVFQKAEVFVIYGCSEVSCMGCTFEATRDAPTLRTYVGKPMPNVSVRILDARGKIVPFGIVGEICFAGAGVVKGYLNRPDTTAEKFVSIDGERFYRTGDMGRLDVLGNVEMLGRRDFQVQVRGMRIELGEIEYTLRKGPGVKDGVVMAKADALGEKTLVAYVVPQEGEVDVAAVRAHMTRYLPDYMLPGTYMVLEKLPLNHNMKVDRNALPDPVAAVRSTSGLRLPESETEQQIAAMWRRLLRVEQVGLDDNFFDLGGHSLLAMEFILDVERELGIPIDGMEVLRETLEVTARLVDERLGRPPVVRALAVPRVQPVMQQGLYFGTDEGLYGVYFQPPSSSDKTQAILVCPPIGQDYVRCQFIVQKFAKRAAAAGYPVMKFDYFGTGNSLGADLDASHQRWSADIRAALAELLVRSRASSVTVMGIRLGGTLAVEAIANAAKVDRLLLWDPVTDVGSYFRRMRASHRQRVKGLQNLRLGRKVRSPAGAVELLGFSYPEHLIESLSGTQLTQVLPRLSVPAYILKSTGSDTEVHSELLDYDCRWNDINAMDDVLPDISVSHKLYALLGATP